MSYKFDALITILNKLDRGEKVTIRSLMDDLEISERTAYRYLTTLQNADFPIYFDRKKKSYVFVEGYTLKKTSLSVEETLAFALAKSVLKTMTPGLEVFINRIESRFIDKPANLPSHIVLKSSDAPSETHDRLIDLNMAVMQYRIVRIKYHSIFKDEITEREIEPYLIFYDKKEGFWYLYAYCHLRKDFRTFAIDRIIEHEILDENFIPHRISLPEEKIERAFFSVVNDNPVEVTVIFDKAVKNQIMRKKWHSSQVEKELPDGRVELRFCVNGYEEIKHWIYTWIPYVEVVKPERLKKEMIKELQKEIRRLKR